MKFLDCITDIIFSRADDDLWRLHVFIWLRRLKALQWVFLSECCIVENKANLLKLLTSPIREGRV